MCEITRLHPKNADEDVMLLQDLKNAIETIRNAADIFTNLRRDVDAQRLILAWAYALQATEAYAQDVKAWRGIS